MCEPDLYITFLAGVGLVTLAVIMSLAIYILSNFDIFGGEK